VIQWFNNLNSDIRLEGAHQIGQLVQFKRQWIIKYLEIQAFLTRFALSMRRTSVSQFFSLLKYFEQIF
jgi:hypothetical protein